MMAPELLNPKDRIYRKEKGFIFLPREFAPGVAVKKRDKSILRIETERAIKYSVACFVRYVCNIDVK